METSRTLYKDVENYVCNNKLTKKAGVVLHNQFLSGEATSEITVKKIYSIWEALPLLVDETYRKFEHQNRNSFFHVP